MATGFMPNLLIQAEQVFMGATPSAKITPAGCTKYLLQNAKPNVLSQGKDDGSGHVRDVKIKYATRTPAGRSVTTDDCNVNIIPAYKEATVDLSFFRKVGLFIEDETIAKYAKEASQTIAVGKEGGSVTKELFDSIIRAANGLFQDINGDLLTKMAANVGVNQATGSAAAQSINFALSTATNPLNNGMTKVMTDAMDNEMSLANAKIIGSGLINSYYMQQGAKSFDQSGLNTANLALPMMYYDPQAASKVGANRFMLLEENAVQLVTYNRFGGFKAGNKGTTILGTISLPVVDVLGDGVLSDYEFDYQLEYIKCPTDINSTGLYGYGGDTMSVGRGWVLSLMSSYDIFFHPSDSYETDDRLYQNNGILLFSATNS